MVHEGLLYMNEEVGPTIDSLWSVNIIPKTVITSPIASSILTHTTTAENATSINLPAEFGQTVLAIDDHCAGGGPGC
jgi:hypothetical protein